MRLAQLLAAASLLLGLTGCAIFGDPPRYRGIAVTQSQLDQLTPGTSSQADAMALLGPPTFHEQFEDNNWIYVSQVTRLRIAQTEGLKHQHVVVLAFNDDGTLKNIDQKDLRQSVPVAMDSRHTPIPGGRASILQQIIGGVGTYNPIGSLTGGGASAGGAGSGAGGLGGGTGFGGGS